MSEATKTELERLTVSNKKTIPKWVFTIIIVCCGISILLDGLGLILGATPKTIQFPVCRAILDLVGNSVLILLALGFRSFTSVSILTEE